MPDTAPSVVDDPMVAALLAQQEEALRVALAAEIDAMRLARGWSIARTAQYAGLTARGLEHVLKISTTPRILTLLRLAMVFNRRLVVELR